MPVHVDIIENGHVVCYRLEDPWTYADFETALEQDIAHRDGVQHRVHNLLDATKVRSIPMGVMKARAAPAFTHRTAGNLAIIGTSVTVRMFSETVMRLAHFNRAKFFDSEAEALEYLLHLIQAEVSPESEP